MLSRLVVSFGWAFGSRALLFDLGYRGAEDAFNLWQAYTGNGLINNEAFKWVVRQKTPLIHCFLGIRLDFEHFAVLSVREALVSLRLESFDGWLIKHQCLGLTEVDLWDGLRLMLLSRNADILKAANSYLTLVLIHVLQGSTLGSLKSSKALQYLLVVSAITFQSRTIFQS